MRGIVPQHAASIQVVTIAPSPAQSELAPAEPHDYPSLLKNAGVLFAGQSLGLLVPLATIPYLARVLGPDGWGPVLAAQSLGNWLLLVLEFGFELSGTRAVARARTAPHTLPGVVHGVQSAKALLTLMTLPLVVIAFLAIPGMRHSPALVAWAVTFAVLRGFSPLWYFQGIERMRGAVAIDAIARALAALGVFFVVHSSADGWWVLALQAFFAALSLALLTHWLSRHVGLRLPTARDGARTLRDGWSLFACRAWSGLYIQGNTLILSALAGAPIVAYFGGAERIIRAAINLLQPLTQAFLPRVSFLHAADRRAANHVIRHSLMGIGLFGALMGATALAGAPLLVHLLLGNGYDAAVSVLRILGLLPILVAVNTVLGIYWALPFGHDRAFLAAIVAGGITNVVLAVLFVPRLGAMGMAASAVAAEIVVLCILGTMYLQRDR
jgi:polysaccharide transporter, PST family